MYSTMCVSCNICIGMSRPNSMIVQMVAMKLAIQVQYSCGLLKASSYAHNYHVIGSQNAITLLPLNKCCFTNHMWDWWTEAHDRLIFQTRIMATIGVSRGLGDHDLYVYDSDIWIKPFLTCQPEVRRTWFTKLFIIMQTIRVFFSELSDCSLIN